MKHQSFVYTQLIYHVILFVTIQFSIRHSFALSYDDRYSVLFDPEIGPYQVLPLQARVNLGAMAMKRYSAFPKAPVLLLSVISRTLVWAGGVLPLCRDEVSVFYSP